MGALVPWSLLELPPASGELSAPTNDINLTACLALITSHALLHWIYRVRVAVPDEVLPASSLPSSA